MELQSHDAAARGLRRYVHLVAEALALSGDGSYLELEPPVGAYLALDQRLPQFPTRDAALLWDELHGWSLAVESRSAEDLLVHAYLGIDILPAPHVVARFAAKLVQGEQTGQPDPPNLRTLHVQDDLPQRLAAYARTGSPSPPQPKDLQPDLTVHVEHHGHRVVLHVSGDLDMVTAPQLQESISHALAQPLELLILDLTGVRFLASAGIAVLANTHDRFQHHEPVRIVADGHSVLRPLEVVGLIPTLTIYPTLHAALTDPPSQDHRPQTNRSRPAG